MDKGEEVMMKKRLVAVILLCIIVLAGVCYFFRPISIVAFKLKGFNSLVTSRFIILFKPESKNDIPAVLSAANRAYDIVGEDFDYYPENKIPIVVFPDRLSLQSAFNWPKDENTQGVYYRGIIFVQSPGAWIKENEDTEKIFFQKGPMVHEYTHLVVDKLTGGNYPRWFTEGVAQYEEKRVTGYTLEEDFEIDESVTYSYEDILYRFDQLPDVTKAYLDALEMTTFLAGDDGINELKNIMMLLKKGDSANRIFLQSAAQFTLEGKSRLVTNINTNGGGIFGQEDIGG
jgi:hypothetical protein